MAGPDLGPALGGFDVRAADGEALVEALAASQRAVAGCRRCRRSWWPRWWPASRRCPRRSPATPSMWPPHEVAAAWTWSKRAAESRVDACLAIAGRPAVLAALRDGPARLGAGGGGRLGGGRPGDAAGDGRRGRRGGGAGAGAGGRADRAAGPRGAAGQAGPAGRPGGGGRPPRGGQGAPLRAGGAREDGMAELRALLTAPDALRVYAALGPGRLGGALRASATRPRREARAGRGARGAAPRPRAAADPGPVPRRRPGRPALRDGPRGLRWRSGGGSRRGWGGFSPRRGAPPGRPHRGPHRAWPAPARGAPADPGDGARPGRCWAWAGSPPTSPGTGRSPTRLARELARDGVWRRVLTDPESGAVLDVGRSRHDPPADLERFVRIRDAMCRFPGCRRQASGCDLDHTRPVPRGRDVRGEPARPVPPPPPPQARDRLAGHRPARQPAGVDQPARRRLHHRPAPPRRRSLDATQVSGRRVGTRSATHPRRRPARLARPRQS